MDTAFLLAATAAVAVAAGLTVAVLRNRRIVRDDPRDPSVWEVGPIIRGRNISVGRDLRIRDEGNGCWSVPIPQTPGHIHYITFRHGPLKPTSRIEMEFEIVAEPGVEIVPKSAPGAPAMLTLYFQRRGDDWSGRGAFEAYRWFASAKMIMPLRPGTRHRIATDMVDVWTAVEVSESLGDRVAFLAALRNADRVGFVLGGGTGLGHGIYATGPARLRVRFEMGDNH